MNLKNKVLFGISVLTLFIGDIITTYYGLYHSSGYESNPLLSWAGFGGTIIFKMLVFAVLYWFITILEKKDYQTEIGVMNGAFISTGLIAILINTGFYT